MGSEYARVAKCLFGGQLKSFEEGELDVAVRRIMSNVSRYPDGWKEQDVVALARNPGRFALDVIRGSWARPTVNHNGRRVKRCIHTMSSASSTSISESPGHFGLVKLL